MKPPINGNGCTHVYIGTGPCGCWCFAVSDVPGDERDTAREIKRALKDGLRVERMTCEAWAAATVLRCETHRVPK